MFFSATLIELGYLYAKPLRCLVPRHDRITKSREFSTSCHAFFGPVIPVCVRYFGDKKCTFCYA
jgi:hypothetical protein